MKHLVATLTTFLLFASGLSAGQIRLDDMRTYDTPVTAC